MALSQVVVAQNTAYMIRWCGGSYDIVSETLQTDVPGRPHQARAEDEQGCEDGQDLFLLDVTPLMLDIEKVGGTMTMLIRRNTSL